MLLNSELWKSFGGRIHECHPKSKDPSLWIEHGKIHSQDTLPVTILEVDGNGWHSLLHDYFLNAKQVVPSTSMTISGSAS